MAEETTPLGKGKGKGGYNSQVYVKTSSGGIGKHSFDFGWEVYQDDLGDSLLLKKRRREKYPSD